jgi:hypothetical protein
MNSCDSDPPACDAYLSYVASELLIALSSKIRSAIIKNTYVWSSSAKLTTWDYIVQVGGNVL